MDHKRRKTSHRASSYAGQTDGVDQHFDEARNHISSPVETRSGPFSLYSAFVTQDDEPEEPQAPQVESDAEDSDPDSEATDKADLTLLGDFADIYKSIMAQVGAPYCPGEEVPNLPGFHPACDRVYRKCRDLCSQAIKIFDSATFSDEKTLELRQMLDNAQKVEVASPVLVGLLGKTGAGK